MKRMISILFILFVALASGKAQGDETFLAKGDTYIYEYDKTYPKLFARKGILQVVDNYRRWELYCHPGWFKWSDAGFSTLRSIDRKVEEVFRPYAKEVKDFGYVLNFDRHGNVRETYFFLLKDESDLSQVAKHIRLFEAFDKFVLGLKLEIIASEEGEKHWNEFQRFILPYRIYFKAEDD